MSKIKKMVRTVKTSSALELKKHVAIIHSTNAFTLVQRKIANALLFNAYARLRDSEEHSIHIAKLCELIGYNSNDTKPIKESLIRLLSTVLEWNLIDKDRTDGGSQWNASSYIASACIDGPICTYTFSKSLRELLYHPEIYGKLDMAVQAKFKSAYGLALYENCNRFRDVGQTPWIDMAKFRKLMGVQEKKYKIFRDFKTRVLKKALEEVNKFSPLLLTLKLKKRGNEVIALQFQIEAQPSTAIAPLSLVNPSLNLAEQLVTYFHLTLKEAKQVLEQYEQSYVTAKLTWVQQSANYQSGKIKNLRRYFLSALQQNFMTDKEVAPTTPPTALTIKNEGLEIELRKLREQYHAYVDRSIPLLYEALTEEDRQQVLAAFSKHINQNSRGIYQSIYQRDNLQNPLIKNELYFFIKRSQPALMQKVCSFETWLEQMREAAIVE